VKERKLLRGGAVLMESEGTRRALARFHDKQVTSHDALVTQQ
jgi:hypothetical protein